MTASARVERIAVCICTYKRPAVLARLLEAIVVVAEETAALAEVSVVVIDDDPDRSAAAVAQAAEAWFPHGLVYDATASGNISVARNRSLELGQERATWLALIDDDCLPDPTWLRELLVVQRRFDAEGVSGACGEDLPLDAPAWLRAAPFLSTPQVMADGSELTTGYLKNTLLSVEFLRRTGTRFDPDFGATGGEDEMFFHAAHEAGLRHRFAALAVVREQVPLERTTLAYQLRRRLWYGNTEARTSLASRQVSRLRMAASGMKMMVSGLTGPLRRLVRRESPALRHAAGEVLRGGGRALGAAGIWIDHR